MHPCRNRMDMPHLGIEPINEISLELAMTAMERHAVHSKVQRMGCGFFRTLSYDVDCCGRLDKSKKVVSTVVDSIRRNPRKVNVIMEGRQHVSTEYDGGITQHHCQIHVEIKTEQ